MPSLTKDNKRSGASATNWTSYIDVGEHALRITGSNFTGSEYVYLDEKLVSKKVSWLLKSTHRVNIDGVQYSLVIELLSLLRPQISIKLMKGRKVIDEDLISHVYGGKHNTVLTQFLVGLAVGGITGVLAYWLVTTLAGQ